MVDREALGRLRAGRFFASWDESVAPERVAASEALLGRLVAELLTLGPEPTEEAAREAVAACVRRFNNLDDGWIGTIEREDLYEAIGQVVDACGFDCDEDWLDERDW